jgi:hypothetical protein
VRVSTCGAVVTGSLTDVVVVAAAGSTGAWAREATAAVVGSSSPVDARAPTPNRSSAERAAPRGVMGSRTGRGSGERSCCFYNG